MRLQGPPCRLGLLVATILGFVLTVGCPGGSAAAAKAAAVAKAVPASAAAPKAAVVALGLWSDQGVFRSEATRGADLVSRHYGHGGAVVVRENSKRSFAAGPEGMLAAMRIAEHGLNPDKDVLFVIMTSHGSPDGIAEKGGGSEGLLAPAELGKLLATSRIRRKVLIVSACYSGIFTPLAGPNLLVITAADATHPSFGCLAGATWTYFGNAFFNEALRGAKGPDQALDRVFTDAAARVHAREVAEGFEPSNPQIAGGAEVLAALAAPAALAMPAAPAVSQKTGLQIHP